MPTVLVTGANRGIGAGFVDGYLEKGYKVIAAVRNPSTMAPRDNVIVVKIDAASETGAEEAVNALRERRVNTIDIVIANAGAHGTNDKLKDVSVEAMRECWTVNTLGPLLLYQAVYPLIPPTGRFVIISSYRGKLDQVHETNEGAYGHSKAAANYLVSKIHSEEAFVSLAFNPGWVQTPMGDQSAQWAGIGDKAPQKVEDVIGSLIDRIAEAQKDTTSGKFLQWDGTLLGW